MPVNHTEIEEKLWTSADELRASSHLISSEYSVHLLGTFAMSEGQKGSELCTPTSIVKFVLLFQAWR